MDAPGARRRVKVLISPDVAWRRLVPRFFVWMRRRPKEDPKATPGEDDGVARRLPLLELVWMPYFLVVVRAGLQGHRRPEAELACLVDSTTGTAARFQPQAQLFEETPGDPQFPPRLSVEKACDKGRELLLTGLRGPGRRGVASLGETLSCDLVDYPYWVFYYLRRRGKIDLRILDAVSGARCGTGVKVAVVAAFTDAHGRGAEQEAPAPEYNGVS